MEIEGEVQIIKHDRKALAINSVWYNSFKPISDDFKKGDFVKITYGTKGDFQNIKSIIKLNKYLPKEVKLDELDSTTKNCILMTACDLAVEFKSIPFNEWVKEVKRLREGL